MTNKIRCDVCGMRNALAYIDKPTDGDKKVCVKCDQSIKS